jgi:hypothetical protein
MSKSAAFQMLFALILVSGASAHAALALEQERSDRSYTCAFSSSTNFGRPNARYSEEEWRLAEEIQSRAQVIAAAYLSVEVALREAGLDPDAFVEEQRSWIGIIRAERMLVGVYHFDTDSLVREDVFWTDEDAEIVGRMELAEQALASTPRICSESHGVIDSGLVDEHGNELLFALRIVNRQELISRGLDFRFTVIDGSLQHIEQLGLRCGTAVATYAGMLEELRSSDLSGRDRLVRQLERRGEGRPAGLFSVNPETGFPTETDIMQMMVHPDAPYRHVDFMLKNRVVRIPWDDPQIPRRYTRAANPCVLETDDESAPPER